MLFDEMNILIYNLSSMDKVVTVLRPCHWCLSNYPIVDFRDDAQFERSLDTLSALLRSTWKVEGSFLRPVFFVRHPSDDPSVAGKFVPRDDPDAPRLLDGVEFERIP
jgi:hypothetical protein